jgi:hypothetical protein
MTEPTHVLVPRELTGEMICAGIGVRYYEDFTLDEIWEAMLAAAPPPPALPAEAAREPDRLTEAMQHASSFNAAAPGPSADARDLKRALWERDRAVEEICIIAREMQAAESALTTLRAENTRLREALEKIAQTDIFNVMVPNGVMTVSSSRLGPWAEIARAALAAAPAQPEAPGKRAPKRPELDAMFAEAKDNPPSDAELAVQRESFVRGEMGMGSDADEAEYRRRRLQT